MKALIFELDGRRWALGVDSVRQVSRAVRLDPPPPGDELHEGVVVLHGEPVPVLDLRKRLGLAPAKLSPDEHLVFAEGPEGLLAFRVDRALGVAELGAPRGEGDLPYAPDAQSGEAFRLLRSLGALL